MYDIYASEYGPMAIEEQAYASSDNRIRFQTFDSCVGVVVRKGNTLHGVHLVMTAKESVEPEPFDQVGAANVLSKLPSDYDSAYLVGFIDEWSHDDFVSGGYLKLAGSLHNLDQSHGFKPVAGKQKCVCTVSIEGGKVLVRYDRYMRWEIVQDFVNLHKIGH